MAADDRKYVPKSIPVYFNAEEGLVYWKRRDKSRILGIGCNRPDKLPCEQFYYHHLLLAKPFCSIIDLIDNEVNEKGTCERQCQLDDVFGDEDTASTGILALDEDLMRQKVGI